MRTSFFQRFQKLRAGRDSLLCVGLDPDPARIPAGYPSSPAGVALFLTDIVTATASLAVAYKPNFAFFEAMGPPGFTVLAEIIAKIRLLAPESLIIGDAKRGDIGNTAAAYARAVFDELDCDAVTVSPYMGPDTLEPFLAYADRATVVLCLTSNPGAERFQSAGNPPLYLRVAEEAARLNADAGNLWLVVGATRSPEHMRRIREVAPDLPWLVPGVGAQGGSMEEVIAVTGGDALINASRSILYAATERSNVAAASRSAAEELAREMRRFLK